MTPRRIELVFSALFVLLLVWVLWEAQDWPNYMRLFPWSIGFSVLGLALLQLGSAMLNFLRPEPALNIERDVLQSDSEAAFQSAGTEVGQRVIVIIVWTIVFFLGIWFFGFKVGSLVLTYAFLKFAAKEQWRICTAFSGMTYLFFLIVFDVVLSMPLFPGLIAQSFGLESLDSFIVNRLLEMILR